MGSLLLSIGIISLIITLFREDIESDYKIPIGCLGYLLIWILVAMLKINFIAYFISGVSVLLAMKYKTNFNIDNTKWFLIFICVFNFFVLNAWAFAGIGLLWFSFDYGFFHSLFIGFKDMNSSFDFMIELANQLLLKTGDGGIPEELRVITDSISKDFNKLETIKTIMELLEYL